MIDLGDFYRNLDKDNKATIAEAARDAFDIPKKDDVEEIVIISYILQYLLSSLTKAILLNKATLDKVVDDGIPADVVEKSDSSVEEVNGIMLGLTMANNVYSDIYSTDKTGLLALYFDKVKKDIQ